jgi:hypothetical protein
MSAAPPVIKTPKAIFSLNFYILSERPINITNKGILNVNKAHNPLLISNINK